MKGKICEQVKPIKLVGVGIPPLVILRASSRVKT